MATDATEAVLTFGFVSVIPGAASGAQNIAIVGATRVDGSQAAQGGITTIVKGARKQ